MKPLIAIALDDEPIALELLSDYAARLPFVQLAATFTDPFEAMAFLKNKAVDLLFLDIQMPDLTGFQFLQALQIQPPAVIFTTAFRQYALEGFNLDAVDYLLKPYDFQRFTKAVNKAQDWLSGRETPVQTPAKPEFIFVKSEHQLVKVMLADILWLEAWGDYVKIHTQPEKPLLTLTSLSVFAEVLPDSDFVRVHRSFVVNLSKISLIQRNRIFVGEKNIPLGDAFAEGFYKKLPAV
jgi:DNA-binding LytR/AlgR family response regulator